MSGDRPCGCKHYAPTEPPIERLRARAPLRALPEPWAAAIEGGQVELRVEQAAGGLELVLSLRRSWPMADAAEAHRRLDTLREALRSDPAAALARVIDEEPEPALGPVVEPLRAALGGAWRPEPGGGHRWRDRHGRLLEVRRDGRGWATWLDGERLDRWEDEDEALDEAYRVMAEDPA